MTKNLFPMSTIILYNQLNALYKRPRLTLNREYLSEYLKGQSVSKTDIAKIDVELHSLATCEYFSKFLFHIQSAMAASASFRMSSSLQESAVAVVKVMAFVCGQILFRQHHRQCKHEKKHRFPKKTESVLVVTLPSCGTGICIGLKWLLLHFSPLIIRLFAKSNFIYGCHTPLASLCNMEFFFIVHAVFVVVFFCRHCSVAVLYCTILWLCCVPLANSGHGRAVEVSPFG